jgi:hypothetical protein
MIPPGCPDGGAENRSPMDVAIFERSQLFCHSVGAPLNREGLAAGGG